MGKPEYTSTAEVQISLVDVNDHFPKFDRPSYIFSINEGDYRINKIQVGQVKVSTGTKFKFKQLTQEKERQALGMCVYGYLTLL